MVDAVKTYMHNLLKKGMRESDRGFLDYREINVEDSPIKQANGSARVRIGKTEVIVGVKLDVGTPFPDNPADGTLICNAELSPMANADFEPGPPDFNSIELARVTDRAIRESETIDMGKLCISEGEKVWMVYIDIYPINAAGNLFDASVLAAMRALKLARLPKYDKKSDRVEHSERTSEGLPLSEVPVMCTFSKLGETILLDADEREENVADCRISVATVESGNLCAMQKGGEGVFTEEEVLKMIDIAAEKGKELRKLIK